MGQLVEPSERSAREREPARPFHAARGGPAEMGNALEVLRVLTTLFVVLYHAGLTYVATPLRLTLWVVYDQPGHTAFDVFIYWVNGFAMPVFFLAAGVSAPAACESRGARVFLAHRAGRLLRPLLFGCLSVLPLFYLLWGYGLLVSGRCTVDNILNWRFSPAIRPYLYGVGHLWFLEYLFLVCVVWCACWSLHRAFAARGTRGAGGETDWSVRLLASPWRPVLFAVPTCLMFLVDSDTMLRVDNTVIPNPFRLLHYTFFFAVGAWIARVREPKQMFIPHSRRDLVISLVLFGLMSPLLFQHAAAPLHGSARIAYCVLAALFPWFTVFGALGVLLRFVQGRGPALRFLSEASFWVYIVHVPIVALAQLLLLGVACPVPVKFLVVSAAAVVLSLLSYEFIVRRSLVGEIVNGARKRTTKRGFLGPELGWVATLGVLALVVAGAFWHYRVFFWGDNLHAEVAGQIYRSGRLTTKRLDELIRRKGIRTVITFTAGGNNHPWYQDQRQVCQSHDVALYPVILRVDARAGRPTMLLLISILERAPRPILVQSNRGLDQSGFTVALDELLAGAPVPTALRQFDARYGQIGGVAHSPLGQTLLEYQQSLSAHHQTHTPQTFLTWAHREYGLDPASNGRGAPTFVPETPDNPLARGAAQPAITR